MKFAWLCFHTCLPSRSTISGSSKMASTWESGGPCKRQEQEGWKCCTNGSGQRLSFEIWMFFGDLYLDPTKSPCLKKWPKSPFFLGGFIVPWPKSHVNRKERLRVEGTYFPIFVDQVSWIQRCFFLFFFPSVFCYLHIWVFKMNGA